MQEKTLNSLIACEATKGPTYSEHGDTGIDRFGHFAGLTTSPQFLIWPVERCAVQAEAEKDVAV
jgi:hypothetical protein